MFLAVLKVHGGPRMTLVPTLAEAKEWARLEREKLKYSFPHASFSAIYYRVLTVWEEP